MTDFTTDAEKFATSFVSVMEEAMLKIGAEKFELEDVDGAGDYAHVLMFADGTAVLFEYNTDSASVENPHINFYRKEAEGRSALVNLVTALDLMWTAPNWHKESDNSWLNYPVHVALVKRLAELMPDAEFAVEAKGILEQNAATE